MSAKDDDLATALYRRSQRYQSQRGDATEPEHACQVYVTPHGRPLTKADCEALMAHVENLEHRRSLAGLTDADCCWVFDFAFRHKQQQIKHGGNAPLTWRRYQAATSGAGSRSVPPPEVQVVNDLVKFLMHHLVVPVQNGAEVLERCPLHPKCARPSHARVGRVKNKTPQDPARQRDWSAASAASVPKRPLDKSAAAAAAAAATAV